MRKESFRQYRIIAADGPGELTDQLNRALYELRDKAPEVEFDGLIARISYTETITAVEDIRDEYALKGVRLTCQDCPMFVSARTAAGGIDRRMKRGGCEYAPYGMAYRDSPACEKLFGWINSGEIQLCKRKEKR